MVFSKIVTICAYLARFNCQMDKSFRWMGVVAAAAAALKEMS